MITLNNFRHDTSYLQHIISPLKMYTMKKFIMICLAVGFVNFVSAQTGFEKGNESYRNEHENVKEVRQKNRWFRNKEHVISARDFNEKSGRTIGTMTKRSAT
jgi:hypothetical protein